MRAPICQKIIEGKECGSEKKSQRANAHIWAGTGPLGDTHNDALHGTPDGAGNGPEYGAHDGTANSSSNSYSLGPYSYKFDSQHALS